MLKILYIEDEKDLREDVSDLLKVEGYDVVEAQSGEEGIQKIAQIHPDLILCDVNMPDISGFDILREIKNKKDTLQVPFIFITAMAQKSDKMRGLTLCADDYIVKPVDFDVLLATIKARIERSRSINHLLYASKSYSTSQKFHQEFIDLLRLITDFAYTIKHDKVSKITKKDYLQKTAQIYSSVLNILAVFSKEKADSIQASSGEADSF